LIPDAQSGSASLIQIGRFRGNLKIIQAAESKRRKTWRELDVQNVIEFNDYEHNRVNVWRSLFVALRDASVGKGFVRFVAIVQKTSRKVEELDRFVYQFVSNQPAFSGRLRDIHTAKIQDEFQLADIPPGSEHEAYRNELQIKYQAQWDELLASYKLYLTPFVIEGVWDPIEFTFDGENRSMTIKPLNASGNMDDYPLKLSTTSELLVYCAAVLFVDLAFANMDLVYSNVSLSRLTAAVLDREFDLNNIRVAVDDPEEWDYINPKFDVEARLYIANKDT
jgi:hypothetical protein